MQITPSRRFPSIVVFQRAAHQASKKIYTFKPAPRVKPVLDCVEIAKRTVPREWTEHIGQALIE